MSLGVSKVLKTLVTVGSVGFTLEQGFWLTPELNILLVLPSVVRSLMRITGPFGQVAFGRMGAPWLLLSQLPSSVDGHSALRQVPALERR